MGEPKPYAPWQERVGTVFVKQMSRVNTAIYRRSKGRYGAKFPGAGSPVCLVTTTGRKSGQPRSVPLIYLRRGDDVVIVASKGGMSEHPDWFLNLRDDPKVSIQVGADTADYTARVAGPDEKAALWPDLVAVYADYDTYQKRTDRDIPVVVCEPA
jgi:deazaflavin-dependent oxidoreductase (nitroreductase family)